MKDRILSLLGNGFSPAITASAVGCSESYVSQLLSDEQFSAAVSELRFNNLQAANARDTKIDAIEDELLKKLKEAIPLMMRPMEITKAAAVVNAMKRRGSSAPEQVHIHNQVIALQLPSFAKTQFQFSSTRELVEVAGRALITMPSAQLLQEAKQYATDKLPREAAFDSAAD